MKNSSIININTHRHPELVSGSIELCLMERC